LKNNKNNFYPPPPGLKEVEKSHGGFTLYAVHFHGSFTSHTKRPTPTGFVGLLTLTQEILFNQHERGGDAQGENLRQNEM